ncbi:MAG TPA: protein-disulfide reductase DsbD domain-containing protein [Candidatus Kapabacteria bacterium]|nr:protein-disulfide reductase DsbD domain-containing protein [Candidatus Kapabacteria bacterium]
MAGFRTSDYRMKNLPDNWKEWAAALVRHGWAAPVALMLMAATSAAQQASVRAPHVEARLIASHTAVAPGTPVTVGLLLRMEKGWHTYWRNPGDAGMATSIVWELPAGAHADSLRWPVPELIGDPPEVTYGYGDFVMLQSVIHPPAGLAPGSTFRIGCTASWLVCREICLPGTAELALTLPVRAGPARADSLWNTVANSRQCMFPNPPPRTGVTAQLHDSTIDLHVLLKEMPVAAHAFRVQFFAADEAVIDHSAVQTFALSPTELAVSLRVSSFAPRPPRRLRGVLEVEGSTKVGMDTEIDVPIVNVAKQAR